MMDKLSEKHFYFKSFDNFFLHYSTEFLVVAFICRCFLSHKTYCDVLLITYAWQNSYFQIERTEWLAVKAIEFNGC